MAHATGHAHSLLVLGGVRDAGIAQCLLALHAGAALAALPVTALVAAPRLGVVYAESRTAPRYVGLCDVGVRSLHRHAHIRPCLGGTDGSRGIWHGRRHDWL